MSEVDVEVDFGEGSGAKGNGKQQWVMGTTSP